VHIGLLLHAVKENPAGQQVDEQLQCLIETFVEMRWLVRLIAGFHLPRHLAQDSFPNEPQRSVEVLGEQGAI